MKEEAKIIFAVGQSVEPKKNKSFLIGQQESRMSRYIDADALMEEYNLDKATKYGNKTGEEQSFSYSTMMMYEIADMIDDAPTADVVEVVRCKDCTGYKLRKTGNWTNKKEEWCDIHEMITCANDYCSYGERKDG